MRNARRVILFINQIQEILSFLRLNIMQKYILKQWIITLLLCLTTATSLFLVIEAFERMKIFIKEDANIISVILYLLFKIPLIVHLMLPVAVLVAALITVGRLSQLSEITAMRACGASILSISKPLILGGSIIALLMFISAETLIPWATQRTEEIYHLDIRKKDVKGTLSQANIWSREGDKFYSISFYDSRNSTLKNISILNIDTSNWIFTKRIDAGEAVWNDNPLIGWSLKNATEIANKNETELNTSNFRKLPLVIEKKPQDFFNIKRASETLSYSELNRYVKKLQSEGIPVTPYLVDLAAKISFPLVNVIVMFVAIPFGLIPARSGKLGLSFIAGISIGFGYHVIHALSTSLGAAELIPVFAAAWTANILLGALGAYLLIDAEYS